MEYAGFIILGALALGWLVVMIIASISFLPYGLVVLLALFAFGLIFSKVAYERLRNKEDDYYSRTVQK